MAKKRFDKFELEKKFIARRVIEAGGENPFNEVFYYKNFWIGYYRKSGLKLAPFKEIRILPFKFTYRYDTLVISLLGHSLVIKNWAMRSKKKPAGAIWNYTFKLLKNAKKND
jgi:hypothetical protein